MSSDLLYYEKQEDYEEIKDYLDMEPVDDSISPDQFPPFTADFSSSIVIDNIPQVPREKIPRLLSVLLKIYVQISPITESDVTLPINEETGLTYGFCFIKFSSLDEAESALRVTQGLAIDKKHTFKVSLYTDLDKFSSLPEEYVAPEHTKFNVRPDPTSWLTDTQCRDQFVLRHSHDTEIFWANNVAGEDPNMVYGGEREKQDGKVWCESYVCWSPQGTYLATFHVQGIKLWGSTHFESQGRFMHAKVEDVSFSPCENYLTTYRYTYHPSLSPEAIIVWDIRTGEKLRAFELKNPLDIKFHVQATITETKVTMTADMEKKVVKDRTIRGRVKDYREDTMGGMFTIEEGNTIHEEVPFDKVVPIQEPNRLKWSPDGKYVARIGNDIVSVYTLPNMTLLDKKSIAAKEVLDFVWSPKSSMISYWSPAVGNHPALINIMKLPERTDLCSRKLFDVTDGRMVWQNEGDYLCVYMTKMQGKKKSYVLMFFRTRDAGVPVEQLELSEPILNVSWEPSGDKIVIIYGEARTPNLAFYSMSAVAPVSEKPISAKDKAAVKAKSELTHLFTKSGGNCSEVSWSPAGGMAAFAYFASDACVFELYDVENNISMATRRHDRCNKLYWDPSGRYIVSCTITDLQREKERETARAGRPSNAPHHADDGYNIYTFQGVLQASVKVDKMYQFAWRPRPKDLLSAEEKKKVVKNLRKYEKMFESKDKQRKQELVQKAQAARFKQAEEFYSVYIACKRAAVSKKSLRVALRDGYDSEDERHYRIETTIDETVLSSKEVIM